MEVFQANRVAEIQEWTEGARWSHIVTKDNLSDLCSRGMSPQRLQESELWWYGPNWLSSPQSQWPKSNLTNTRDDQRIVDAAVKIIKPIVTVAQITHESPISINVKMRNEIRETGLENAFGSWRKLIHVTAYVMRFIHNCRNKKVDRQDGLLLQTEMQQAEEIWLRHSQQKSFAHEIANCNAKGTIDKKSPLHKLLPFIEKPRILCSQNDVAWWQPIDATVFAQRILDHWRTQRDSIDYQSLRFVHMAEKIGR